MQALPESKIIDFFGLSRASLQSSLEPLEAPRYVADQIYDWVYRKGARDFSEMTNLGKNLRDQASKLFSFPGMLASHRELSKDGTRKYLFKLPSEISVESVMIKQPKRMTLCVSSQYGCGMACAFCRTGTMGFLSNLSSADIIRQLLAVKDDAKNFNDDFSNIVFMGMGEPLHNYKNVFEAIRIMTDDFGMALAPRRITVSTVGLVPAIKKFFEENLGVNLAISLNATTDEVRSRIMPVNKNFPISELLGTIKLANLPKRKKVTIEYVLLAGVNDSRADMKRLVSLLRELPVKVNLIPYNSNSGLGFFAPDNKVIDDWHRYLNSHFIDATIRWSKGQDINAACGQLLSNKEKESSLLQIES